MEVDIVPVVAFFFIGVRQCFKHERRMMILGERLAAVEKGIDPPRLEEEERRTSWGVQRFLLLAGLCWISLGVGAFWVLSALLAYHSAPGLPAGLQWIGLAPVWVGISQLIVYAV